MTRPPLVSVTVTFHPDLAALGRQLAGLPADALKVVVDNASPEPLRRGIAQLLAACENGLLVQNLENRGLAAALNQGVAAAARQAPASCMVLLLDQDSEPEPGSIDLLGAAFEQLAASGVPVGAVGPALFDAQAGMMHGFHQADGLWWKRIQPAAGQDAPVRCTNLNGSGTLMPVTLFEALGGLDETLFIDHVDTEWSFRLLARGYLLFGIPAARFRHRMGAGSRRIWLMGWRVWPERSPLRHRFLFRNTVTLLRRAYVPAVWKFWAIVKMMLTICVVLGYGPLRRAHLAAMAGGIRAGIWPRRGNGTPG